MKVNKNKENVRRKDCNMITCTTIMAHITSRKVIKAERNSIIKDFYISSYIFGG